MKTPHTDREGELPHETPPKKKILKYLSIWQISFLLLLSIILFTLDKNNNLFKRVQNHLTIERLRKEIEHNRQEMERNKQRLEELTSDPQNLEKFARENYPIKGKNEEVFIIKPSK